jgi:hypothetical protein
VFGRYRLANRRDIWAEARRNCQQEGASLAVVNSEQEANNLRDLYINSGSLRADWEVIDSETTSPPSTEVPPANATVHIGLHDIFIEGEYLTVRSKFVCLVALVLNWLSILPLIYTVKWR